MVSNLRPSLSNPRSASTASAGRHRARAGQLDHQPRELLAPRLGPLRQVLYGGDSRVEVDEVSGEQIRLAVRQPERVRPREHGAPALPGPAQPGSEQLLVERG